MAKNILTKNEMLLLGSRLRNRREALGLTQEYIAEKADITLRFYQMLERGSKGLSLQTLIALSKALTISIDELLFGNSNNNNPPDNYLNGILANLTPQQYNDAIKILQLYANACHEK